MFGNNLKRSCKESIKYIANSLVRLSQDGNGNVIGVSSSRICKGSKESICKKICKEIQDKGINLMFINIDGEKSEKKDDNLKNIDANDILAKELEKLLNEQREKNDMVIVNIPSVAFVADGVEYSRICGRVVLLEKYMYSTYKDYEESLIRLKSHGVRIDGVVAYGA